MHRRFQLKRSLRLRGYPVLAVGGGSQTVKSDETAQKDVVAWAQIGRTLLSKVERCGRMSRTRCRLTYHDTKTE